jgi:hypothetical protein
MKSSNITQQNKVLDDADIQRIRVTIPHHPLYNQSLRVVRRLHTYSEPQIVVELPDGHTQLIPTRWTEAVPVTPREPLGEVAVFSHDSLRALITMVASLIHQNQPEACDELPVISRSVDHFQSRDASATDLPMDRPTVSPGASPAAVSARRNS